MNFKQLILFPIFFIGLTSCAPDSRPKILSYNEAINYIKNNYKGEETPKEGWLHYSCKDPSDISTKSIINYLGASEVKENDRLELDQSKINSYIDNSKTPLSSNYALPLMHLNESNFKAYINNNEIYTYQLTYLKEFIVSFIDIDSTTYTRHYNPSLRLTRFEIHNPDSSKGYDILQTYLYN